MFLRLLQGGSGAALIPRRCASPLPARKFRWSGGRAVLSEQLRVRAVLRELPVRHDEELVGVLDGGKAQAQPLQNAVRHRVRDAGEQREQENFRRVDREHDHTP